MAKVTTIDAGNESGGVIFSDDVLLIVHEIMKAYIRSDDQWFLNMACESPARIGLRQLDKEVVGRGLADEWGVMK